MPTTPSHEFDFVGQRTLSADECCEAKQAANDYSVSLVRGNDPIGSATLVSIGSIHGLLTADHVWQALCNEKVHDHFGMVLGSRLERFECPFQECTTFVVGAYSSTHEEEGPDLVFIRLDGVPRIGTLKSRKSFYPLETQRGKMFEGIPYDRCPWLLWGAPVEKSSKSLTAIGEPILRVIHFAGDSEFDGITERNGFDYVKIKITSGVGNFPSNYGGVSGGGVWIAIRFSEDPEGKVLNPAVSLLLVGVAYYQKEVESGSKILLLHGPKSIYERVISRVLQ